MDKLDKKIRKIMIHRKPEHFLDDIFMNLLECINDDYQNCIFYKKGNILLFYYNSNDESFYYDYDKIYVILREKYHCNDNKINELIRDDVEKHLKLSVKTTRFHWLTNQV